MSLLYCLFWNECEHYNVGLLSFYSVRYCLIVSAVTVEWAKSFQNLFCVDSKYSKVEMIRIILTEIGHSNTFFLKDLWRMINAFHSITVNLLMFLVFRYLPISKILFENFWKALDGQIYGINRQIRCQPWVLETLTNKQYMLITVTFWLRNWQSRL